eukprot:CAMPEP_0197824938 /NCGR_PEP_ID=MMETSP1437-20131217/2120_1 /TAXON_ID=49252 ORGANISM="Eucampia antarctica, Strain CCMP1452" /NCGR_SAMPLE_ID=MMETSP1437 /ASSEMBLY_ACC=CAM_ASM_001096 /LENGTH=885 /DNA_ID=CAMNT_0043424759 /DNA_START=51 /DNA_END=2708 /DNA_ORIENTATION=-
MSTQRSVLIGRGRRVTLEELWSVALGEGHLDWHDPEQEFPNDDEGHENTLCASVSQLSTTVLEGSTGRAVGTVLALATSQKDDALARCYMNSVKCSKVGISPDNERLMYLAMGAYASVSAYMLSKVIDGLAATSIERLQQSLPETEEQQPHRGIASSAAIVRACLQGSKFIATSPDSDDNETAKKECCLIPQIHGPAKEVLHSSMKTIELELNVACNNDNKNHMNNSTDTVACLAFSSVLHAVHTLIRASWDRSNHSSKADAQPTINYNSLEAIALALDQAVKALKSTLKIEATLAMDFQQTESETALEQARLKEAEKASKEASYQKQTSPQPLTDQKDEFAGKSEAAIAKILKKRAEKEAKKAAKKKQKTTSTSSIFGAGTLQLVECLRNQELTNEDTFLAPSTIVEMETITSALLSGGVQRKPKIAKGTRDYLPDQMMIRDKAFTIIRRVFRSHGAVEIDTPVFELKDTLTGKYGEDSKLIYDLADQGGELLALRYDLTVPFARFLALNNVGNIKRFHIGKVYRRDQPALSRGRYREFYQCDFDIAGNYGRMVPDAECVAVAAEILAALPIGEFGIKLNHRCLLDAILDISGVPADKFRTICSAVDKLDKEPWSEVKREMVQDKGLSEDVADKIGEFVLHKGSPRELYNQLMDAKAFGNHKGALKAMEDLKILFNYLDAMGKLNYVSFDLSLARGLDYYTGVIYEAVCMNGNTQVGSIGGGGRYDNLVSMFQEAGKVTPCVGVSIGIERVFTLMEARLREQQGGSIKQPNVQVLVATVGNDMMQERMKISKLLWDANISAEFSQQENPKLKYEITNALDRSIPLMVIIGDEEAAQNKCKVKDLVARTEETVDQSALVRVLLQEKNVVPVGCEFAAEFLASKRS